jgi:hypothetical protein
MIDEKARQILFDTYWTNAGWRDEPSITSERFAYARDAEYMFDPIVLSHDKVLAWIARSYAKVSLADVSNAFLSSLSTRRLDLRSALGSYAIAHNFPQHSFIEAKGFCAICGMFANTTEPEDLSVLNFERFKWGGVRHLDPIYIAFDLERFATSARVPPSGNDLMIMQEIIAITRQLGPTAKLRDLEKSLVKAFMSNRAEREVLIQILSYCGIFQPQKHSGFFKEFTNYTDRTIPPVNKIDWTYPACWWRGNDGVNSQALTYYFPQLSFKGI